MIFITAALLRLSYALIRESNEKEGRYMDALFILIVTGVVLLVYGVVTYSLYVTRLLKVFIFEKVENFFTKKGGKKMIPSKLTKFLKRNKIYYQTVMHPPAFTSLETAEAEHVSSKALAKVVMARVGEKNVMLVLPASHTVDLLKLSNELGKLDVRIEEESEFKELFPDCETGAMPPFGRIYHLPCYVDKSLLTSREIYFNAGTHTDSIKIWTDDFRRIMKGHVKDFAVVGKKIHENKIAV